MPFLSHKKIFVNLICFLACFASPLLAHEVNEDNDFQLWFPVQVKKKLTECTMFLVDGEIRYGDGASTAYLAYWQVQLGYSLSKLFSIAAGYRNFYVFVPPKDEWREVYAPIGDLNYQWEWKKWKWSDRVRILYHMPDFANNFWVFRNLLVLTSPWEWGRMKWNPIWFDEVFFNGIRGLSQNRFAIGGRFPLTHQVKGGLFYVLRHQKTILDDWNHQHVLYLQLKIEL